MAFSPRRTRLQRKQLDLASNPPPFTLPPTTSDPPKTTTITAIPSPPPQSLTKLPRKAHALLLQKQSLLRRSPLPSLPLTPDPTTATLVFAQEEAGTAVCIRPDGLLLTCAHCVAETAAELDPAKTHWLLFASGAVVAAVCVAWDGRRDLALLRVTAAQGAGGGPFPAVRVAERAPGVGTGLVCVGHPGSEDLEVEENGVETGYPVLYLSMGNYRGCEKGQDVQDNSEIGALRHDCWTYWGHSGAPLLQRKTGRLVGLHSSWDDSTGVRRGVPLEAIKEFLDQDLGSGE